MIIYIIILEVKNKLILNYDYHIMYLLNLYIIKDFFSKFIFIIISFNCLFLIVDIVAHINKFVESDIPKIQLYYYYIYSIQWFISISLPMTTLLSCIFAIGQI